MQIKSNKLEENKKKIKQNLNHFECSHGRVFFLYVAIFVNLNKK